MLTLITRDDLRAELDAGTVTLVDALPADYWAQRHLPGALNLVESDVTDRAATLLPDRSAPIVVYCANTACPNSQAVGARLVNLGYTDVRKYREGIQDWVEAGLPVQAA